MEDDLLGQAQAVLSGSTPKGGGDLLSEAMDVFKNNKPDPKFAEQEDRMQQARVWANQKRGGEKEFGFGLGLRLRTRDLSLPFQGVANSIARGIAGVDNPEVLRVRAQEAFGKGEATDEQLARLALYEYEDARNKSLGTAGAIGQGVAHAAPIVGEALVGGGAVKGLGGLAGSGATRAGLTGTANVIQKATSATPVAGRLGQMAQGASTQALATPLTPGLWLDESQQRAAENGGNWYDPKNVAAPMLRAAFQNAIMGHLGEATKGLNRVAPTGAGVIRRGLTEAANLTKRGLAGGALMPIEQAGADALTTLGEKAWKAAGMDEKWTTDTDWGTVKRLANSETRNEGIKELAVQSMMGSMFSAFHGGKSDPVKKMSEALESLKKEGVPQDLAERVVVEATNRPPETIKNTEVKAYVESIIDLVAAEPPKTRSAGTSPEPVQSAAEAQKSAPAKPQTAHEALARLEDPFREYTPKGPKVEYRPPAASERMVNEVDAPTTPVVTPKKKGLGKKELVLPKQAEPVVPARVSEDATRPNVDLEDFFSKPAESPPAPKPEGPLRKNDMLEDLMGMESAPPIKGKETYTPPEPAKPVEPIEEVERRETYGEPPGGVERRRFGLKFEGSEPLTEGATPAEKHAIDKYGKEGLYRVKVNDAEGKEVADAIIKEEGDTLIVPWLGKKGASSGEGKGKDIFGAREITALGKQLAEAYPDMNILKYQVGNARNAAGEQRIIDLNKYRARQAKKAEAKIQPASPVEPPKETAKTPDEIRDEKYKREVGEMMKRHEKVEKELYDKYQKASNNAETYAEQADAHMRYIEAKRANGFEKDELYRKTFKETANAQPEPSPAQEGTRGEEARPAKGLGARQEAGVSAPAASGGVGRRVVGAETSVKTPGTKAVPGRYEVREMSEITASNKVREDGRISKRPANYPEGLQPRDYSTDKIEQEKVRRFAQEMETAQYLSDDPNATGGPSTITPDGIVLNGNGRHMSLEESARTGTYSKYRSELIRKAGQFGIDPKAIEGMDKPVLVRVVNMDAGSPIAKEFARRGNIATTQGQSPTRTAASLGGMIDNAVIDALKLEGDMTFAEAVNDPQKGAAFRKRLREAIPANEVPKYFNADGGLTDSGKEFVRDMLLSKVIPVETIERMQSEMKAEKRTLEGAIPQLLQLNKSNAVNPTAGIVEAVGVLARNPRIKTIRDADNALAQKGLFGGNAEAISPEGRMMLDFILQDGQKPLVFRKTLAAIINDAEQGTKGLFAEPTKFDPAEAVARITGVEKREGAKFKPAAQPDPEGFGQPLTPEEKNLGMIRGGSPAGDGLSPMDGGLKELALANENVDAERRRLGLPPLMQSARKTFGEAWDRAMVTLGKDPNASAALVNELSKKMRNLSVEESALLLHRHIQFNNAYERAIRQANAVAFEAHKTKNYDEFNRLSVRVDELLDQIKKIGDITKATGSEAGRTLAFRRQLAAEDYTLGKMMGDMTMAKKAPLTADEMKKVQDQHDRIAALEARLRDFEAKEAAEADVIDLQPAEQPGMIQRVKEWLGSLFPRQRPTLGAAKRGKVWDFADRMEKEAASELKAKFGSGNLFSNPMFDPSTIASLSKYTAAKIIKSGLTFADFSSQIIARFGDAVKPHLKEIWDGAQKHVEVGKMDKVDTQVELKKTKAEVMEDRAKFERKNQSVGRKLWEGTKETNNLMRAIQTAWDVSAVGRQGVVLSLTHPTKVPAAVREMVQSIRSERGYERNQQEILNRRNALDYQLSELEFTDHHADPTKQEESLMGRYVQKLPGLAASSRAFNGYLNRLRADVFDAMTLNSTSTGPARMAELKAAANWINAVTGRGKTGYKRIDDATAHLAQVFFSPRHALSRFQVLSGQPFWGAGTWKAKKMIAKEYAKYAIGMGAVYGLAKLALGDEAEIEKDSRSSDFGKIKIGKTRIDPLAGFSQSAVVSRRLLWGEMKAAGSNEVKDLRGPGHKFKDPTSIDVAGRFIRNKLSPLGGEVSDKLFPEFTPPGVGPLTDATGRKKGLTGWAIRQADKFQPLTAGDIYDAFKEHGIPRATALSLLNLLGWGTQVHERQPKAK